MPGRNVQFSASRSLGLNRKGAANTYAIAEIGAAFQCTGSGGKTDSAQFRGFLYCLKISDYVLEESGKFRLSLNRCETIAGKEGGSGL